MRKLLLVLYLLPFCSCEQDVTVLNQEYSFLGIDEEVQTIRQSHDTLFFLKCYVDRPCQPRPGARYKLLSSQRENGLTLLKLERLDSIPLTTEPFPDTRFSVVLLKVSQQSLGYFKVREGLEKHQLDTIGFHSAYLKSPFFFTYLSQEYLEELSRRKPIITRQDAKLIVDGLKIDAAIAKAKAHYQSGVADIYHSGLNAELLTSACIEKGYNPIGAGVKIESLLR